MCQHYAGTKRLESMTELTNEKKQRLLNLVVDISTHPTFQKYRSRQVDAVKAAWIIILLRLLNLRAEL